MCLGTRGGLYEKHHLAGRHARAAGYGRRRGKSGSPPLRRATSPEVRLDFLDRLRRQHRWAGPRRHRRHAQAQQVTHDVVHKKMGVTISEIMPHQPRTKVVPVIAQKCRLMHDLQSWPRTDLEQRTTSAPMFWWNSTCLVGFRLRKTDRSWDFPFAMFPTA